MAEFDLIGVPYITGGPVGPHNVLPRRARSACFRNERSGWAQLLLIRRITVDGAKCTGDGELFICFYVPEAKLNTCGMVADVARCRIETDDNVKVNPGLDD